jgi:hypothetical protein
MNISWHFCMLAFLTFGFLFWGRAGRHEHVHRNFILAVSCLRLDGGLPIVRMKEEKAGGAVAGFTGSAAHLANQLEMSFDGTTGS